jgi:HEAT repeat protein
LQGDDSLQVRAQAAETLGRFVFLGELGRISEKQYKKVEEVLLSIMEKDESEQVRQRALESLGYSSHERVGGLIEDAYDFGDEDWQSSALYAMGRTADEKWTAQVLERLDDPNPEISKEAARAAGEIEISDAISSLLNLLKNDMVDVRLAATWSLSQIGGEIAAEALEEYQDRTSDEDEIDLIENALENLSFTQELNDLPIFDFADKDLKDLPDSQINGEIKEIDD